VVSLEHRLLLLEREGIAATLVLEFDERLRRSTPEEFTAHVFREALGVEAVLMGFDSAYGYERRGTYEYLHARERELGIEVRQTTAELVGGARVSSTLVREAIARWDLRRLEELLGRRFALLGRVVAGDGRGRKIGFPTANLDCGGGAVPPSGVYFAEVLRLGREPVDRSVEPLPAVVNIGERPTFAATAGAGVPAAEVTVEAHLLDLPRSTDLYGEYLEVVLLARHRDERRFASVDALVAQIECDVAARRELRAVRAR
jgi:riboflavin kinase/FMN adenylyltransferase